MSSTKSNLELNSETTPLVEKSSKSVSDNKLSQFTLSDSTKNSISIAMLVLLGITLIVVLCFWIKNIIDVNRSKNNCKNNGLAQNGINCNQPCKAGDYNLANGDCTSCPNGIADNKLNCNQICDDPSNSYNLPNGDCTYCEYGVTMNKKACKPEPITPAEQIYKQNYRHYNRQ